MISVTETSPHGHRRNGATLCPACKISPTRSSFVGLSVKSGRFVCSGQIVLNCGQHRRYSCISRLRPAGPRCVSPHRPTPTCVLVCRHGCGGFRHTETPQPPACVAVDFYPTASAAHDRLLSNGRETLLTSIQVCQTNFTDAPPMPRCNNDCTRNAGGSQDCLTLPAAPKTWTYLTRGARAATLLSLGWRCFR